MRALRRDAAARPSTFPQDVLELQGYLADETRIPTVHAIPGRGTNVPLYILGSSLFGAQLAAALGLPVRVRVALLARRAAGRGARLPGAVPAVRAARPPVRHRRRQRRSRPTPTTRPSGSSRCAGARSCAASSAARATVHRREVEAILRSPQGMHIDQMLTYTAVGTPDAVKTYLDEFRAHADADELMSPTRATRPRRGCARSSWSPRPRGSSLPRSRPGRRPRA